MMYRRSIVSFGAPLAGWLAGVLALSLSLINPPPSDAALPVRLRSALQPPAPPVAPPAPPASFRLPQQLPPPGAANSNNYNLSRDVIRRVIYVHINQIKYCYQQELFRQPKLAGRLVVNFQINPQGQVHDIFIQETDLNAPALLGCISETMQRWEFPPTPYYEGVTQIIYPFLLRPKVPEPPGVGIQVSDDDLARIGVLKDPEPPPVDILF